MSKPVFDEHFVVFATALENLLEKDAIAVNRNSGEEWTKHQKHQMRFFIKAPVKGLNQNY